MTSAFDYEQKLDIGWCPGCGNFAIRQTLIAALDELGLEREKVVLVSGIGQAAKMPQYLNTSYLNGLHGRALPVAAAVKACNPELSVIAVGGDGDMYGEGGNHFMHAIRRNPDIALFVHDNMVYGLTKGQAAPTSRPGMKTPLQVAGVYQKPLNPLALAISLDASFVARSFSGDPEHLKEMMKKAIRHKGLALVDIFQPCVSFNKLNSFDWFKRNSYRLPEDYDPRDRAAAFAKALEEEPFPLGVLYESERLTFEEGLGVYARDPRPLYERRRDMAKVREEVLSRS
ncbi:MAG TPA: thiamine pyrophosphate-dependent enzyme [Spirochaetia bacterium]|nr:thiamine pyrophosphate-dependent enzyme [Spirochaetia bacterium]HRZ64932.1 thiamine pyrophosphate-dependent enzyme [Spirochaetia bacterium]